MRWSFCNDAVSATTFAPWGSSEPRFDEHLRPAKSVVDAEARIAAFHIKAIVVVAVAETQREVRADAVFQVGLQPQQAPVVARPVDREKRRSRTRAGGSLLRIFGRTSTIGAPRVSSSADLHKRAGLLPKPRCIGKRDTRRLWRRVSRLGTFDFSALRSRAIALPRRIGAAFDVRTALHDRATDRDDHRHRCQNHAHRNAGARGEHMEHRGRLHVLTPCRSVRNTPGACPRRA